MMAALNNRYSLKGLGHIDILFTVERRRMGVSLERGKRKRRRAKR